MSERIPKSQTSPIARLLREEVYLIVSSAIAVAASIMSHPPINQPRKDQMH